MDKNILMRKLFAALDQAELELKRDDWRMSDIDIWPIVKIYYSYSVLTNMVDNQNREITNRQKKLNKAKTAFKILWNRIFLNFFDKTKYTASKKATALVFVESATRFFKIDGSWYSPYSDTLQAGLNSTNIDSLVYEISPDAKFASPIFGPSINIQWILLINSCIAKFKSMILSCPLKECANWPLFMRLIESELGPGYQPNVGKIAYHIRNTLQQLPYFTRLIKSSGCSVCIMSGYYSSTMFALIKACRAAGVTTIEVQHGVQGEDHFAYGSWRNLPADDSNILPDYFWNWSVRDKESIDRWANHTNGKHKAFIGGNPCLTIYNKKGENITTSSKFLAYEFLSGVVDKTVLFTCQDFNELPEFIIHAIRMRQDFGWVIRIHPAYWSCEISLRAQCEKEQLKNVIIDRGDLSPLVSAMQCATIHITEYSSSVLEATAIGLNSVVIHPFGRELYSDLIVMGKVYFADHCDDILKIIESTSRLGDNGYIKINEFCFMEGLSIIKSLVHKSNSESKC